MAIRRPDGSEGSACEQTIWQADTGLLCKVPAGIRGTRKIIATSGQRDGSRTEIFSYDNEGVSSMGPLNAAATGAQVVTVSGLRFGIKDYTNEVRFGFTACERTRWISDSTVLTLSAAGVRSSRRVVITVIPLRALHVCMLLNYDSNDTCVQSCAGWRTNHEAFCFRILFI